MVGHRPDDVVAKVAMFTPVQTVESGHIRWVEHFTLTHHQPGARHQRQHDGPAGILRVHVGFVVHDGGVVVGQTRVGDVAHAPPVSHVLSSVRWKDVLGVDRDEVVPVVPLVLVLHAQDVQQHVQHIGRAPVTQP